MQHKRGSTKLLKATNRGFSFATELVKKEDYKPELKSHISAHSHVTE